MDRIRSLGFMLFCIIQFVKSDIEKITGNNIRKRQNEGKFMMIFVTKSGCEECSKAYSKFIAASQTFDSDEIMFGRTEHTGLAAKYGAGEFPSLLYCRANSKKIQRIKIDITVETIVEFICNITRKDFTYIDKHYTVELAQGTFDDVINTPRQYKLVLLYDSDKHNEKIEWLNAFAKIYKNDDKIIFCRLNTYLEGNLRGRFKAKQYPVLYWYTDDEIPQLFIYGGGYEIAELMKFVEDHTGIKRKKDGSLTKQAGILKDYEKLFTSNKESIIEGTKLNSAIKQAKSLVDFYEDIDKEMAEYYTYLLEEVAWHENTSIFDDEFYYLQYELNKEENGPKRKEIFFRKKNIIDSIINIFGNKLLRRNSKNSPLVFMKDPRPHKHDMLTHHEEL